MSTTTPRQTPETDDNLSYGGTLVTAEFARMLERERDEAREQLEAMRKAMSEAAAIVAQIPVAYDDRFFRAGQWANAALTKLQPFIKP